MEILTLLYGGGFHLFNPANEGHKPEDGHYELVALSRMHRYFGPFPDSIQEIADDNAVGIIDFIHSMGPPTKPCRQVTRREIPPADRDFVLKIMKLDYRDRPPPPTNSWRTNGSARSLRVLERRCLLRNKKVHPLTRKKL